MIQNCHVVILAAGQGKRMRSDLSKVLHAVGGKPLIWHVLQQAQILKAKKNIVVVAQKSDALRAYLQKDLPQLKPYFAVQKQQLGTGDAVRAALQGITGKSGFVVVLNGDMPLLQAASLQAIVNEAQQRKTAVLVTTVTADPTSDFGRVLRDKNQITGIIEKRDATPAQKNIAEVNVGVYVFDLAFLRANIHKLKTQNQQKEYYLTDLVALAARQNLTVAGYRLDDAREAFGVNSQSDLHRANAIFYERQRQDFLNEGVAMLGDDVFIDAEVQIAAGTRLEAPCYLKGQTRIGAQCQIETGVVVQNSDIAAHAKIKAHSYLVEAVVASECEVGPFAHLRPGTQLKRGVKVGNFVEIKKSTLGEGSKANHLAYLGDATIGKAVNVGAGTITCNYDGQNKFQTIIEDGVFIGSDSQLVAPVKIGKGAFVAAGTTVTKNVSPGALALSRVPQAEKRGWARKKRKTKN